MQPQQPNQQPDSPTVQYPNPLPNDAFPNPPAPPDGNRRRRVVIGIGAAITLLALIATGVAFMLVGSDKPVQSQKAGQHTQSSAQTVENKSLYPAVELVPFRSDYLRVSMLVPRGFNRVLESDADNSIVSVQAVTIEADALDDAVDPNILGRYIEISTGEVKDKFVTDNSYYNIALKTFKNEVKIYYDYEEAERKGTLRFEKEIIVNGMKVYMAEIDTKYTDTKDSRMNSVDRFAYFYINSETNYTFRFTSDYNDAAFQQSVDAMVNSVRIQ